MRTSGLSARDLPLLLAPPAVIALVAVLTKSFWGDEILSMHAASGSLRDLFAALAADYHPPLYFLLLRGWMALFGDGETGLRIFQALQGSALLAASLALFRMTFPERRVHPAFSLLLLNVAFWLYMPMLRYYTLAAFFAVLSTVLYFRWQRTPGMRSGLALSAVYLLLLYTDYPSSFVILAHLCHALWMGWRSAGRLLLPLGASAAAFLPWATLTVFQIRTLAHGTQVADLNTGPAVIALKLGYSIYALLIGETLYPIEAAGIAAAGALAVLALLFLAGRRFRGMTPDEVFFPAATILGLLCTSVITTFLSKHTSFVYTPARTFYVLPFVVISIGIALDRLPQRRLALALGAVLVAVSAYGIVNVAACRHFFMPVYASPWKEIAVSVRGARGLIISDESLCYEDAARRTGVSLPRLVRPETGTDLGPLIDSLRAGSPDASLFLVLTERESSPSEIPKEVIERAQSAGPLVQRAVFVPYDDTFKTMKRALLKREPADGKIQLFRYAIGND